jgi:hypothetical protein
VLSVFKIFKNYTFVFQKNHQVYSMNTQSCSEYSCEVSVEITLYFDLEEKKTILWLCIGHIFVGNLYFMYSPNISFFKIPAVPLKCLYVCTYLI